MNTSQAMDHSRFAIGCLIFAFVLGTGACDDSGGTIGADGGTDAAVTSGDAAVPGDAAPAGDAAACPIVMDLPARIMASLTVGPGCVTAGQTEISNGATLTINPGTTVLMKPGAFFDVGTSAATSAIVAVGTPAAGITFTSIAASPLPGDWQCLFLGRGAVDSEFKNVAFKYGGALCKVNGAPDNTATLIIEGGIRGLSDSAVTDSLAHAIIVKDKAGVRAFANNRFARNGKNGEPSLLVATNEIITLGTPNTFEDADDFIQIESTFSAKASGTWKAQAVPLRTSGFQIDNKAEIKIAAGSRIKITGGTIEVFNANLITEGTPEAPVTFTSANATPLAGDWGCITFESVQGTPSLKNTVIEYAGNGSGCTGAKYKAAINSAPALQLSGVQIRNSAGFGIATSGMCSAVTASWCAGVTFSMLASAHFQCVSGTMANCP